MTAHPYMAELGAVAAPGAARRVGVGRRRVAVRADPGRRTASAAGSRCRRRSPPRPTLRRHLVDLLARNETCERNLSFLGGGVWQHHVPAICDEIAQRTEFVTPVWGTPSSDHGRNQAWFEFASQLGELIGMDFVGLPVYSWGCAEGHAIRMAARITGRASARARDHEPRAARRDPDLLRPPELAGHVEVELVGHDAETGGLDLDDLSAKLSSRTAAVLFENPGYLGAHRAERGARSRRSRARPAPRRSSASTRSPSASSPRPREYGADIVVGSVQPLGVHMSCGGGAGGFIATRDEERYAREYPTLNLSIGRDGRGRVRLRDRALRADVVRLREDGNDWTGNSVYLHAVANAAYMALMGPEGFAEVGR